MQGSRIVLTSNPRGIFLEGVVSGTPYPGTVMEIQLGTAPNNNEFTWRPYGTAYSASSGDPRIWACLIEDDLQGFPYNVAYTSGQRCKLYVPIPGEQMNMIFAGAAGTGSANKCTIGERLIAVATTGLLAVEATSSVVSPFMALEHIDFPADVQGWVWVLTTN